MEKQRQQAIDRSELKTPEQSQLTQFHILWLDNIVQRTYDNEVISISLMISFFWISIINSTFVWN